MIMLTIKTYSFAGSITALEFFNYRLKHTSTMRVNKDNTHPHTHAFVCAFMCVCECVCEQTDIDMNQLR